MSQFKSREEYEQWKAGRMQGLVGNFQPKPVEQRPHRSQAPSADLHPPSRGGGLRSLGELFGDTWDLFKARFLTLICLYLLSVVFMVVGTGVFAGGGYLLGSGAFLVLPLLSSMRRWGLGMLSAMAGGEFGVTRGFLFCLPLS
jgi:hypothetical protein